MPAYSTPAEVSWEEIRKMQHKIKEMKKKVDIEVSMFYYKWNESITLKNFPKEIRELQEKL